MTGLRTDRYDRPVNRATFGALLVATAAAAGPVRLLVDEVVAVVATHSITLSEVRAEARIQLVLARGAAAAELQPDRALLAATLRQMIDQRMVLAAVESLRTFEVERTELEGALMRFRGRLGAPEKYEVFTRRIDMTDDEIGQVLGRQLRYARFIDSKVKLQGGPRQAEAEEHCKKELGRKPSAAELEACGRKLQLDRYRKVTEEVLSELRKRIDVRILDSLDEPPAPPAARDGGLSVGRAG